MKNINNQKQCRVSSHPSPSPLKNRTLTVNNRCGEDKLGSPRCSVSHRCFISGFSVPRIHKRLSDVARWRKQTVKTTPDQYVNIKRDLTIKRVSRGQSSRAWSSNSEFSVQRRRRRPCCTRHARDVTPSSISDGSKGALRAAEEKR